MTGLNIALLSLLLSTALAFPQYAYKPSGGYGNGAPFATGGPTAPFGQQNLIRAGPTGTGSVSTVTVIPLPVEPTTSESPTKSLPSADNGIETPTTPNVDSDQSGIGSTNSVSKDSGSCEPATVIVTSRNTVTVTVEIPASSQVPVHVISQSTSSVAALSGNGPFTSSTSSGPTPVANSTGVLPVSSSSSASAHKHGYHHKGLHHKSRSSSLGHSSSVEISETSLASSTTTPTVTTPEASSILSPSAPEITAITASIASSDSVPETTSSTRYKAPVPSSNEEQSDIHPITPQIYKAAFSYTESPSPTSLEASSTSVTYNTQVLSSTEATFSIPLITLQASSAAPSPQETPSSSASLEASSSPVYQPPSFTSAVSQPVKSTPATSAPGTKRGLVYNSAALTQSFSSSPAISWCYNWDSQPGGDVPSNFDFVPMMWGPIDVHTSNWKTNADSAIAKGSTHLLGFNEPDLPEQANLTPQQAADSWNTYMEPYAGKAKLGSPAVCNGGGLTGLNWLDSFFDACSSCTIDFVPIHWYGLANDAGVADFKDHTAKAIAAAKGKPVWITEFKPDGSPEEMSSFMTQILPFLDSNEGVERYSWFEVDDILVSGGSLTDLGTKYAA